MKCRVRAGNMYFVRFDDMDVVMRIDDAPGALDSAKVFDSFEDAYDVAMAIGARPVFVEEEEGGRRMKILDACCGSRMFWFDKEHKDTLYMDKRVLSETLCDGRLLEINPDMEADFRDMPFPDNSFYMVVFDPPHLIKAGENSWLAKKYGLLDENWKEDIAQGFRECMRVLRPNGTLIFKWNEEQIPLPEILKAIDYKPLLGQKRSKTQFLVFMKEEEQ